MPLIRRRYAFRGFRGVSNAARFRAEERNTACKHKRRRGWVAVIMNVIRT